MDHTLRILGNSNRHITSFEKNTILRLNNIVQIEGFDLIYDETLYDVDDRFYLLLRIQFDGNKTVTTTTDGETHYEALLKGVEMTKSYLIKNKMVNSGSESKNWRKLQQAV